MNLLPKTSNGVSIYYRIHDDVGNDVLSCHSGLSFSANSASRILYTCSAQDEPDYETALGALDLAHRWQVEAVVAILTDLLAGA
jgi:hypothetical protein